MKIDLLEPKDFSDFWRRALARLIDGVIGSAIIPMAFSVPLSQLVQKNFLSSFLVALPSYCLWIFLMMRFGGTPGKLLLNMRIVDAQGKFLSIMPTLKRLTPEILILLNSAFQLQMILRTFPGFEGAANLEELANIINRYGGPYTQIANFLSVLFFFDCLIVLFHPQKQAGHDLLAGSYVVNKSALQNP